MLFWVNGGYTCYLALPGIHVLFSVKGDTFAILGDRGYMCYLRSQQDTFANLCKWGMNTLDQELAGGNLCFVCQKVPWYVLKGECFYFLKTHFLQKSDGA